MADPIEHVIVLMFENNSFDRMLGCMKAVYAGLEGVDPNHTWVNPDFPDANHLFAQLKDANYSISVDPGHELDDVLRQTQDGNTGFVQDFVQHAPKAPAGDRYEIMGYFSLDALPALHMLARNFLVCDHWFSSVPGPTWPNRFFVHSGTSLGHTDMPNGFFQPAIHLYDQPTIYQRLSQRGVSWEIYYGDVPQSLILLEQLKLAAHYHHLDDFVTAAGRPAQNFPAYVFIEPYYFGAKQCDQHPPTDVRLGEAFLAQVYNALRRNEKLWMSTLLVVLYDEHGGFFDHVQPPATIAPDEHTKDFGFDKLGVRVPAILVSPWLDPGILQTQFDHTSLLRYAIEKWGLGPLGNRAAQANSFADVLTRRATPRDDCPASLPLPSGVPNPLDLALNAQQAALAGFTHHLEVNYTKPDDATVARHSRMTAGAYEDQSQAVAERVRQFLQQTVNP
ncbi:MAG TPA: alkaline phosphatase family protein [Candidatus Acidoferrales bacterium]|jgi:phospholipase C|nr:alkaline phosphatase family protein [Candidatus Acidoferrales bacterium]